MYYSKISDGSVRISTRVFGSGDESAEELLKYHPTIAKQRNVKLAFFNQYCADFRFYVSDPSLKEE